MNYKNDNFIASMHEIYENSYHGYGLTQNNKRINTYCLSIFNNPVDNIRSFSECLNSKYWNCLENAAIMNYIAHKNGCNSSTIIVRNNEDNWSMHGIIKIGDFYYDKNWNRKIEFYTKKELESFGYKIYNVNFDFGFNRDFIWKEIQKIA